MSTLTIQKATKRRSKLRLAFDGPAGSGKTFTALSVGAAMARQLGGRVGLVDTERGSASLYADKFDFDVVELDDFAPDKYVEAIHALEGAGYAVIVVDSLSHAWDGKGGALDLKDRIARKGGNDYTAWRDITPMHNRLVDAMLQSPCHVIGTMRTKMEYVLEPNDKGKMVPKKIGMAPIQRAGMEFEFTIVGDLDHAHVLTISKTRCDILDGQVIARPGEGLAKTLLDWLNTGEDPLPATPTPSAPAPTMAAPPAVAAPEAGVSPQQTFARFGELLRAAKDQKELDDVAAGIGQAVTTGKVTATERSKLIEVYVGCSETLGKGAAA